VRSSNTCSFPPLPLSAIIAFLENLLIQLSTPSTAGLLAAAERHVAGWLVSLLGAML
jgi:hypothetical protein